LGWRGRRRLLRRLNEICTGGAAGFAGAGALFAGCVSSRIEPVLDPSLGFRFTERVSEVVMKRMAHQVVARERKVAAPRGPKAV
jgi:hypothetical protein